MGLTPNPPLLGEIQDAGQTHSGHPLRRDGQAGGWIAQALRAPNAAEGPLTKTLERGRPFAQGELETGRSGQRESQAKDLDELSNGVVECTHSHPEPVLERACSCPESRDVWGGELNSHEQSPEADRTHRRAGATDLQRVDHTGTPRDPLVKSLASKVLLPTDLAARRSFREQHSSGSSR